MTSPLSPEARAAGARHTSESVPDTLDVEWFRSRNEQLERVLRLQYDEGEGRPFPAEWDLELQHLKAQGGMRSAIQTWAYLKHLYRVRDEQLTPEQAEEEDSLVAAMELLRRQPVVVQVCGRAVAVTSRSYSAMAEISMHELAIQRLHEDVDHGMEILRHLRTALETTPRRRLRRRRHLRRRIRRVEEVVSRTKSEAELHRMAVYAHALTESGGPSHDVVQDAPDWWREATAADDAVLLGGLFRAGPLRYAELGKEPPNKKESKAHLREDLGFASLYATWEPKLNLRPAELYDRDLAQTLTLLRASAIEWEEAG